MSAIIEHDPENMPAVRSDTTVSLSPLVEAAMSGQLDTEKLKQLLEIQKDHEANEAKKAYHKAVAEFKKNPPDVIKDKKNSQYNGSGYTSKSNLMNTVNAALSPFGLSVHFTIDQVSQPGTIGVTAILTHEMGHSEQATMFAPPDTSGQKNPIQQIKSTKTYLEIATYESVTGIAASDAGDDDGNAAGGKVPELITDEQVLTLESKITDNNIDPARVKTWMAKAVKVSEFSELNEAGYKHVMGMLDEQIKASAK